MDRDNATLVVRLKGLDPAAGTPMRLKGSWDNGYFPLPDDGPPQLQFLGRKDGIDALRPWCDSLEEERVQWFPSNGVAANNAAQTWGGIVVHSDDIDKLRMDQAWMRMEVSPAAEQGLGL